MTHKLRVHSSHVHFYEIPEYQQKARQVIPVQTITERAQSKLKQGEDIKEEVYLFFLKKSKKLIMLIDNKTIIILV